MKYEKKHIEDLEALNQSKLRFFTNISHEFRTPLTLIVGQVETLLQVQTFTPNIYNKVLGIYKNSLQLRELITELLDFRKQEQGHMKIKVSQHNLVNFLYENYLLFLEYASSKQINFKFNKQKDDIEVWYDQKQMQKVINNLLSNAVKHTKAEDTISINVSQEKDHVIIEIKDTGTGIAAAEIDKIFDRFYQTEHLNSLNTGAGTGIGLALVKNLVKLHEGDIQVKSLPEIGTTFYLRLPAGNTYPQALHGEDIHTDKQDGKEEEPIEKQEVADKDKNARPIILVVEDNADIRDYIADSFTDLYEIKTAANGKEGLQIATDCIPDIIVSDIMMPVMNGVVMCQKLKADIRTSHIPVILLTAKDSITDKEEGYQAGADSYLTKPFSAGLLQSRISNLLTQRRLLSERFAIRPDKPKKQSMEEKRAIITESMNKLDKEFLDKITNTITEGLAAAENIDITVLSNVMCMSSSTLYRKVKALTGMSTNEYIRKIKMQLAEKYLLEGKYSISEIAFKVGINSNVYFRQCFKEEFGMSASDYLKQLTGKSIDEKVDE